MKTSLLAIALSLASAFSLIASEVPEKAALKTMTEASLTSFGDAVKDKDFSSFYGDIASIWQKQTTAEKLKESFKTFLDKDIDLPSIVTELKPVFDKPAEINSDDVLVISGYYPTKPNKVKFRLKYLEEEGEWKLVGINVESDK